MIVTCKKCGKQYRLNPLKIQGSKATATCTLCKSKITVYRPDTKPSRTPHRTPGRRMDSASFSALPVPSKNLHKPHSEGSETKKTAKDIVGFIKDFMKDRRILGLREKFFLLFFIIPIFLIIIFGFLFIGQLKNLSALISDESVQVVTQMAEQIIIQKGYDVAREVKNYLESHPELKKEDFNTTPKFLKIAMQDVGVTGYTLLVERETLNRPEIIWVHPNSKLIGIDITGAMKQKLKDKWERWDQVRSKPYETKGYYTWFDNREKYCACIPIEGTPFNIVSSTYIDEFTKPMIALQKEATFITKKTKRFVLWIIFGATLLVASITLYYGHRHTKKIKSLTQITDRISVGDMDVNITLNDKDELGDLAQAISRMQDSIRLSIDRLRRRRTRQAA